MTNAYGTVNYSDDFAGWEEVVFTIGDSFTQGTGVPPDAAYPFQLDLALNAQNGAYKKQFAVINLGLGAYGLSQEIITARRFARLIRPPDYILQLGYGNDVDDDILFRSGYQHTHLVRGNPNWFGLGGELGWISERVEIIKRIKLAVASLRRSQVHKAYDDAQGASAASDGAAAPTLASRMETQYFELKALSDELGAKLIVSWVVCEGAVADEGSYAWLKQWSANNGVLFADWCDTAMSVVAAQPKLTLLNPHSSGHYRPWVNRIVADAFAAQIVRASSGPNGEASFSHRGRGSKGRGLIMLTGPPSPAVLDAIASIQGWTRRRFKLDEAAAVLVSEVACRVPGCPPLETVVAFWTDGRQPPPVPPPQAAARRALRRRRLALRHALRPRPHHLLLLLSTNSAALPVHHWCYAQKLQAAVVWRKPCPYSQRGSGFLEERARLLMLASLSSDAGAQNAPPNFMGGSAWLGRAAAFKEIPGETPTPVRQDPRHRYVPNNTSEQPTYRIGDVSNPNLKPWVAAAMKKDNDEVLAGKYAYTARSSCAPGGVPGFMIFPAQPIHFIQTPKQVWMLYQGNAEVRRIYWTCRTRRNPKSSFYGESVGRYEGDTLVIDTIGLNNKTVPRRLSHAAFGQAPRHRALADGRRRQDACKCTIRIEDSEAFNQPFSVTRAMSACRRIGRRPSAPRTTATSSRSASRPPKSPTSEVAQG